MSKTAAEAIGYVATCIEDLGAIGRPGWLDLVGFSLGESFDLMRPNLQRVDLKVVIAICSKSDKSSVRRPRRVGATGTLCGLVEWELVPSELNDSEPQVVLATPLADGSKPRTNAIAGRQVTRRVHCRRCYDLTLSQFQRHQS